MKRERRQPTRVELAAITSRRPVVKRVTKPKAPGKKRTRKGIV